MTMGLLLAYSIQSAICLTVFFLFYKVLLSRETFHRFNRVALLGILVMSLILPFVHINLKSTPMLTAIDEAIPMIVNGDEPINTEQFKANTDAKHVLVVVLAIYLCGCVITLLMSIVSVVRIILTVRKGKTSILDNGTKLVVHQDNKLSSFSWMNIIAISQKDYDEAGDTIIRHEQAHIALHHTIDLLFAQVVFITQWFNPATWLFYRELQNVHEYEADDIVIRSGIDIKQYQLLLIKKVVGTRLYSIANNLNHSNLKKRITMMLQKKSNRWARLKYAYVFPLATVAMAVFARPEISEQIAEISDAKVTNLLPNDKIPEEKIPEMSGNSAFKDIASDDTTTVTISMGTKKITLPGMESGPAKIYADCSDGSNTVVVIDRQPELQSENVEQSKSSDMTVFVTVKEMPKFPGGEAALLKWIGDHIDYPKEAAVNGIQGRVLCKFTIEKDGSVTDVQTIDVGNSSKNPYLKEEAVRVLKLLPKFTPGKDEKGVPVRVSYSVPVRFSLPKKTVQSKTNEAHTPDANGVYKAVDEMPEFPGGETAFLNWISEHLNYPQDAVRNGIQGRVACRLVVEKDGSVSNVTVIKSLEPSLDKEAIRVLQSLPKFTPGKEKGVPVRVSYAVPVRFVLTKNTTQEM